MFRIKQIEISNHPVFGHASLKLGCNDDVIPDNNNLFCTVVIGENGVGKSFLFRAISDVFRYICAIKNNKEFRELQFRFSVEYTIDNNVYYVSCLPQKIEPVGRNVRRAYILKANGKNVNWAELEVPDRIIVSTMTISDKFQVGSDDLYFYRGVRNEKSPSTTGTRTLARKAVDSLLFGFDFKSSMCDELGHLLESLGLDKHLEIRYNIKHKEEFLRYSDSTSNLVFLYENQSKIFKRRKSELWGTEFFNKIKDDKEKLEIICSFLQRVKDESGKYGKYAVIYNPFDETSVLRFMDDKEALDLLTKLDVLSYPELDVSKSKSSYEFVQSSSGETQQLCQFLSIMSTITANSMVLIDEPENSSHPNWQILYVGWLKRIFNNYNSCHFLIATHSHFILTDLKPDFSRIIALKKQEGKIIDIAEGVSTFCWSVDEILYRVFKVRNTRNYCFESRMYELYKLVSSSSSDIQKINSLIEELKEYKLSEGDPLNDFLQIVEKNA